MGQRRAVSERQLSPIRWPKGMQRDDARDGLVLHAAARRNGGAVPDFDICSCHDLA